MSQEGFAFTTAEMAMNGGIGVAAPVFLRTFRSVQCEQEYNRRRQCRGTLMRYFLFLTRPEPTLAGSIAQATLAGGAVTKSGASQRCLAGPLRAAASAVHVAPIAMPADKDLAMTAGTVVKTSAGIHRHKRPMRAG